MIFYSDFDAFCISDSDVKLCIMFSFGARSVKFRSEGHKFLTTACRQIDATHISWRCNHAVFTLQLKFQFELCLGCRAGKSLFFNLRSESVFFVDIELEVVNLTSGLGDHLRRSGLC